MFDFKSTTTDEVVRIATTGTTRNGCAVKLEITRNGALIKEECNVEEVAEVGFITFLQTYLADTFSGNWERVTLK